MNSHSDICVFDLKPDGATYIFIDSCHAFSGLSATNSNLNVIQIPTNTRTF